MTASFPTSTKTFTTKTDNVTQVLAEHINSLQDEVTALENFLRVSPFVYSNGKIGLGMTPINKFDVDGLIGINTQYGLGDPRGFKVGNKYSFASAIQHAASAQCDTYFLHNAYVTSASNTEAFKWDTSHPSFGSRGVSFQFGVGIVFYADNATTTADVAFTPTARVVFSNSGGVSIGTTSDAGANNLYVVNNVSAQSFTDRTPHYEGDALAEIKKISGVNGEINHETLPIFARRSNVLEKFEYIKVGKGGGEIKKIKVKEDTEQLRDIGAMVSILTVGIQQLISRVEKLEKEK